MNYKRTIFRSFTYYYKANYILVLPFSFPIIKTNLAINEKSKKQITILYNTFVVDLPTMF